MICALKVVRALGLAAHSVLAADIWIQVGGNTTNNASAVFQPESVKASLNDIVYFNCNHTATQSEFYAPCKLAHLSNSTVNGFNSGFRNAGDGSSVTILSVPITTEIENQTLWFYDYNTCAKGGVGVINANESSTQTLAGFIRNAERLNGTSTTTSASLSATSTSTSSSSGSGSNASSTSSSNGAPISTPGGLAVGGILALIGVVMQAL
ncbi:hypothetical protein FISHEDRAFT_63982 [Fistulina hepatica ATCC 64428]|uniref:Uncharacterized protein n=1 Tax=Fistulina hepatica ATCC 64428 TaxID=1128425 RepID=A0A0D7AJH5_9AGAR|nr:hypothetical protein FISHEDRAFT_63982 [Fistulina hepatica ATCC 64428]